MNPDVSARGIMGDGVGTRHMAGFYAVSILLLSAKLVFSPLAYAESSYAVKQINQSLGRGINLGGALEAPSEGDWGLTLEAEWFDLIVQAGFDSVRVPIRWSAHAGDTAPYRIDTEFFERVDWVLEQTARTGLTTIINYHHHDELMENPLAYRSRFFSIWRQIASRYQNQPDSVVFEVLNEPHDAFNDDPDLWNQWFAIALRQIRVTNPTRAIMVGPVGYNDIGQLDTLQLPDDDNLIVSVHYYEPFEFTHQGATWVEPPFDVGISWHPLYTALGAGVQNWSWGTTLTPAIGRLGVSYERQYAGLAFNFSNPVNPTHVYMNMRGSINASVGCASESDVDGEFVASVDRTNANWAWVRVELEGCSTQTNRISLMNQDENATPFDLRRFYVCTGSDCQPLIMSARAAIRSSMDDARDWGIANDRPMHLGEFGALGLADYGSRIRWTRDVASIASWYGISSAYWEFGTGFGVYDQQANSWRTALLRALLP